MTRVMIVDDQEDNLHYLQMLLTAAGYEVDSARQGVEALERARRARPDVVISDLLMPVMDGYTLLRHWKADTTLRAAPFIVYTGTYTNSDDEQLAVDLGADAFILKPAEPEALLARLREVESGPAIALPRPGEPFDPAVDQHLRQYSEVLIHKLESKSAQLEEITGRPVINLGVRGNAAAMETRLMTHYLRIGYRPATVIFLDGINESCEDDLFEHEMSVLVDRTQHDYDWQFGRPVAYAWARITNKLRRLIGRADPPDRLELTCAAEGRETPLQVIHERTLAERDALCRLYAVACRTMVQPFAGVHVRNDDPAFPAGDATYLRELWAHLEGNWRAARATFVTAALEGRDDHAFVDSAHYNAAASRLIAAAIALNLQ